MDVVRGPRRAVPFYNRVGVRREMRKVLHARRAERRPCLLYVHGPDGVGRSTLASEFFHEDPAAFGSLCIEVTARQPNGRLVSQGEMLGQVLRGLGQGDSEQEASDAARIDAYRRLSAGKTFLLIVTDVANADQVRNLIPNAAPDAAVVVITRANLRDLLTLDFIDIALKKLPQAESRELLADCLKESAEKVDAKTLHALADLCGGFPLHLRILGSRIKGRPHAAPRYLAELLASDTALLQMDPSQRTARFLDFTYDVIPKPLKEAYRWLSLLPGPDFSAAAAAVAVNCGLGDVEGLLEALDDANLLIFDARTQRYSFHDVIRADARARVEKLDGPDFIFLTTARIVSWYLDEAVPRDAALSDRWRIGPVFATFAAAGRPPIPRGEANVWFAAEWPALVACVAAAQRVGRHDLGWQMCVAMFKYLHQNGHYDAWLDSHSQGLECAQAVGHVEGIMQVSSQRGAAYLALGHWHSAREDFSVSLDGAITSGNPLGEQSAQEWLGKTSAKEGKPDEAFLRYAASIAVIDRVGDAIPANQQVRMRALLSLQYARGWLDLGQWAAAIAHVTDALVYFDDCTGELENRAKCLHVLGQAHLGAGTHVPAGSAFEQAADLFAEDGLRRPLAHALLWLGDTHVELQHKAAARGAYRRSLGLFVDLGDAMADVVASRIGGITP
ncbi:MAG: hypothetical protein JWQ81_8482 [Amycolatopsis sp.]|uniref:NB-ARC domain-containing protein n=1 Tax=Amycolatopsis sp. TaxID=37632 RepID=UPI00262A79E6|nr:NB-ARC domain-containing protein [Amycolatopsis sp.]MCU1687743.1 hypothetical protein [Amycolatopsis sp.]